ncbi:E3 ubiquitin-protein ligase rnf213-alpha [Melanotaenia boesemani]|uniref:E3 ubiquitin-protein ligase rnf213-alpha n=1 Tax=Melanotaenia boesemani TaxID=1250792 RepID=UPI001C0598F9|nr:E3 ubiquitin-protein ligase rnf213-alpha [Melanotaenia boesemani]
MFCPECGNEVEDSFKFCPECGFNLILLAQKRAKDGATSAHQPSVPEGKNQAQDQAQALKDGKEKQANTPQVHLKDTSDTETSTDSSTLKGPLKASQNDSQPSNDVTLKSTLPVCTAQPSPTPASSTQTKQKPATLTKPGDETLTPHPQEHQSGNRDEDVSRQHSPSKNPSESSIEWVDVHFHAVTSKDSHVNPEKNKIFVKSEKLFGSWNKPGLQMSFSRQLDDKRYLVEGHAMIPKDIIQESIPYKYFITKHSGNDIKEIYEAIYQEDKNEHVNRCLSIKEEFLGHEGEWHQYDDVIHLELKRAFWHMGSLSKYVIEERNLAGKEMLKIIFDLLTSWNKPNVGNFFILLQQFFHEYSRPLLHDGTQQQWPLSYGPDQVRKLLKDFLNENIYPKPSKPKEEKLLPPLHAGVVGLLVSNKYLEDGMMTQLSNLCGLLCLPKKPKKDFLSFWKDFTDPLEDKEKLVQV